MKPLVHERAPAADTKGIRSERIDAVVVCSDDSLLIEMGPSLGDHYRTHTVDIPADIGGRVEAEHWIGIVDVDCVPDAPDAIARMQLQHQRCPLILIASRPQDWAALVTRGAAVAAIGRDEVATSRLSEALMVAEARLHASAESAQASPRRAAVRSSRSVSDALRGRWMPLWVGAVVLLVAWAVIGSWPHKSRSQPRHAAAPGAAAAHSARPASVPPAAHPPAPAPSEATAVAVAAPSTEPRVLELLSAARVAFRDQKLLLPRADGELHGDSALELYMQVLAQDPQNDEALDGLKRLFVIGKARIQSDLAMGKLDDASRLLGLFRTAGVDGEALQALEGAIDTSRPKWLALRAQQNIADGDFVGVEQVIRQLSASGADPAAIAALRSARDAKKLELQLTGMASQVKAAIRSGALLPPADDNAVTRLSAMRALASAHPVTLAAQHAVHAALSLAAVQAMHALQFDAAQRYVSAAADLGSPAQASDAKRQLQTAMAAAAQYAAARQQAQEDEQTRAARTPAIAAARPQATDSPPAHFIAAHPTRAVHAHYPAGTDASGYVIVEFTLSADGSASDASVVASSPSKVFDRSALDAVRGGRYDTRELVGARPERARILLRFKSTE